jgi:hypothetical protein
MHGTIGGPYYKGKGPSGTTGSGGGNTVNNSPGGPGKSFSQKPIPGPESTGGPVSMKKALAPKSGASVNGAGPGLPNRNTTGAGSVR